MSMWVFTEYVVNIRNKYLHTSVNVLVSARLAEAVKKSLITPHTSKAQDPFGMTAKRFQVREEESEIVLTHSVDIVTHDSTDQNISKDMSGHVPPPSVLG